VEKIFVIGGAAVYKVGFHFCINLTKTDDNVTLQNCMESEKLMRLEAELPKTY